MYESSQTQIGQTWSKTKSCTFPVAPFKRSLDVGVWHLMLNEYLSSVLSPLFLHLLNILPQYFIYIYYNKSFSRTFAMLCLNTSMLLLADHENLQFGFVFLNYG